MFTALSHYLKNYFQHCLVNDSLAHNRIYRNCDFYLFFLHHNCCCQTILWLHTHKPTTRGSSVLCPDAVGYCKVGDLSVDFGGVHFFSQFNYGLSRKRNEWRAVSCDTRPTPQTSTVKHKCFIHKKKKKQPGWIDRRNCDAAEQVWPVQENPRHAYLDFI